MIDTEPNADTSVDAGDEITINVSTGPEQREIPDVASLTYAEAVKKLTDAGFGRFKQSPSPSTPELKDRVVGTLPPANQTSAITNEITIVVGSGPESRPVPDVKSQTVESAQQVLNANGFTKSVPVDVDSTEPAGQVVGTESARRTDRRARHRDPDSGVAGQPVHHARPPRPVLDRRRATPAGAGLDRGRWTRVPTRETAASGPTRWSLRARRRAAR